jgi:predicted Zn-dependent protease
VIEIGHAMISRFPQNPTGWFHCARALRSAGRLDEAEKLLVEAPEKFPDHMPLLSIWTSLARARFDMPEALRRAHWLRDRFPDDPSPYTHLTRCLIFARRPQEAMAVVLPALERWPNDLGLKDSRNEALALSK